MKHSYYAIYFSSSALSLGKGFAIAAIIPSAAFGKYSLVTALALFSSILVDSGGTYISSKTFPRLWRDGHRPELLFAIKNLKNLIAKRSLISLLCGGFLIFAFGYSGWIYSYILVVVLASQVAFSSVQSSALRATADHLALAKSAFVRSCLVLSLASLGAYLFSSYGALLGDALGFSISYIYTSRLTGNLIHGDGFVTPLSASNHIVKTSLRGGEPLRLAALIAAVPAYLDRVFVSLAFGMEALGQYSLLMLFVTASSVVAGIGAQKLGPKIVAHAYTDVNSQHIPYLLTRTCKNALFRQMAATLAVGIAGLAILYYTPLAFLLVRYSIPSVAVISSFVLSLFSISIYFDWIMMANDSEQYILRSNLLYIALYAVALLISRYAIQASSVVTLLAAILTVKIFQTLAQSYWIRNALLRRSAHF
jgi:hypothetical protein